jgi:hypothetical protein
MLIIAIAAGLFILWRQLLRYDRKRKHLSIVRVAIRGLYRTAQWFRAVAEAVDCGCLRYRRVVESEQSRLEIGPLLGSESPP